MKTVAVGDIHGCYNELLTLVDHIRKQTAGEDLKWVFVGDYIDRGPASREVIEYLKARYDNETNVFLRGNHEDMALGLGPNYRDSREFAYYNWMLNGGDLTLASYPGKRMSREHLDWLYRTKLFHKDYLRTYVHAGFYRHLPIEQQDPHVLTWIREEFSRLKYAGWLRRTRSHSWLQHRANAEPLQPGYRLCLRLPLLCYRWCIISRHL